jgi:hypothetical protein
METKETIEISEKPSEISFEKFKEKKEEEEKKKFTCKVTGKVFASRSGLWRHEKKLKEKGITEAKIDIIKETLADVKEPEDPQLEALRRRLKQMVLVNPSIDLTKEIKTNKDLSKIDSMEADEIRARISDFQRSTAVKLDKKVSKTALDITGYLIGGVLDCVEELQTEFSNDELLQDSVNDVLSSELLCFIDPKIKVAGLMAMDTGNAYVKSLPRKQIAQMERKRQIAIQKAKQVEREEPEKEEQNAE